MCMKRHLLKDVKLLSESQLPQGDYIIHAVACGEYNFMCQKIYIKIMYKKYSNPLQRGSMT